MPLPSSLRRFLRLPKAACLPISALSHALAFLFVCVLTLTPAPVRAQPALDIGPVPESNRSSPLAAGWEHGAFIEIFVRAWKDSDGDGIGDLRGLTQTLPYLKALGVRGIWLMPITKNADGDHGYATTDYRDIAPEYGTLADFDVMIAVAHRLGIGVIMDYVINHSAAQHPMFVQALQGPANPFRDWYVWADEAPAGWDIWGKYPWYHAGSAPWTWTGEVKDMPRAPPEARGFYFGTFGPHMPDFNLRNPAALEYHLGSLRFWLNRGLDGFRLDAVPHMIENDALRWNDQPESRALAKRLQDQVRRYQNRALVCEATAEPEAYGDPAVCGGAFAFGQARHYIEAARGQPESVRQVADYYTRARPTMASFLSNHDIFAGRRLWDQLNGDSARYKLAAAGYLLQPGTPYIYFGEEIGMAGAAGLTGDGPLRSPMSWTADATTGGFTLGKPFRPLAPNVATHNAQAEAADPQSILSFYRAMLALRNGFPSIARGSYEGAFAEGLVAGWQRGWQGERTLVVINYSTNAASAAVPGLPARARLQRLYPVPGGKPVVRTDACGRLSLRLPAQSVQVYRVGRTP